MITGKELIELGYRPSKWFKEAIEYANQNNLEGDALASYIKIIAPAIIEPFGEPLPFHKNIKAETEAEISNVQQVFDTMNMLMRTPKFLQKKRRVLILDFSPTT